MDSQKIVLEKSPKEENFDFTGLHLMVDFMDCSKKALTNLKDLEKAMKDACIAGGATVLDSSKFIFKPNGFSMIILLAESHASIHTYPEYNSCFIDFFTCGSSCDFKKFNKVIKAYLKPKKIREKVFLREDEIKEKDLHTDTN